MGQWLSAALVVAGVLLHGQGVAAPHAPAQPMPAQGYYRLWEGLLKDLRFREESAQVQAVNRFVNSLRRKSDREVWGQEDYWASPEEFMSRAAGDCEDFVIAKYVGLRRLGVPDSRIKLVHSHVYNRETQQIEPHMVLVYTDKQQQKWVLDNMRAEVLSIRQRGDLAFNYAFNNEGLWYLDSTGAETAKADMAGHGKWLTFRQRVRLHLHDADPGA